jgi:beta-phosphoglucomutase
MILAVIFDLDGTLVETEELKAHSYAQAAVELRPELKEAEVVEAFKDVVGLSRNEVAMRLLQRFGLEEAARARMAEFGVDTPWQAYVQVRQRIYESILNDPALILKQQWPHNIALLHESRRPGCKVALATMSHFEQVRRVLEVLGLADAFDFVATRDDVENGKPDPEIYLLVASKLGVAPKDCLVIEDSPAGVKAALSAGMNVVAVSTPFTRERLHKSALLPPQLLVDNPSTLPDVVTHVIALSVALSRYT